MNKDANHGSKQWNRETLQKHKNNEFTLLSQNVPRLPNSVVAPRFSQMILLSSLLQYYEGLFMADAVRLLDLVVLLGPISGDG